MSLLYAVVFSSRCRSNHHRLAIDALRHLRCEGAEDWRNFFLHFHEDFLKGAKAPDDEFKDFKNHVLHVREGEWGGAIEACEEWYRRTVRALKAKDWKQAAWSAGVLSHYYVDPLQPFHTHQTEEEGVIHRAVEWSFSKSYKTFQAVLEARGGYPRITPPSGAAWLADMVRAGAQASNMHYELIIDHYNFEAGVKDPPAGLDHTLTDAIAQLVGHAVIGLARIFDRLIAEAGVRPAKTLPTLDAFFATMGIPIQAVLKTLDDAAARREVEAQFEEYRRTGKVRATLGEDDKVVRALHAEEVLKTPLSSLDAKWPREIGAQAGAAAGAPSRNAKTIDLNAPRVAAPPPAPAPETTKPAAKQRKSAPKAETPEAPPRTKSEKQLPTLAEDAPVVQAPSIGAKTAKRLEAVGVRTIADLLALKPEEGADQIDVRHISAQVIRDWQAQAALACAVPGMKSREAQALVACGVRTADDLVAGDPVRLCEAVAHWGLSEEGQRAWGAAPAPTVDDIAKWIDRARQAREAQSVAA
ncbi:MAG: DUF4332 domain-containing protein [Hyphomonadaceae bacterium]|nr:DUF4332 domain-containing protein [Hyphomonadaceae bacterium]